jgi:phosphoglycolate phosphatase-like HAD superfamily hydrolase
MLDVRINSPEVPNNPNTVAFDCDGTLIGYDGSPRREVIALLKAFKGLEFRIRVWSGGGRDYARMIVKQLQLEEYVDEVTSKIGASKPLIAVDDMSDCRLGNITLITPYTEVKE